MSPSFGVIARHTGGYQKHFSLALAAIFLFLAGCVATGPKYADVVPDNPLNAVVIVYRPRPPSNIFIPVSHQYFTAQTIYHDDKLVAKLAANAYTYVEIEPGPTTISARETTFGVTLPPVDLEFDAKAGQTYYLRFRKPFSMEGDPGELKIMPVDLAQQEIRKTRYKRASE